MLLRRATFVLLLACLVKPCPSSARKKPPPSAGLVGASVTRTVLSRSGYAPMDATPGTPIMWNDVLQTNRSGRVRVVLDDGSILTVGANSQLRVVKHAAASQQTILQLTYGRIRMQVAKVTKLGESFELRTPTAVAGVIGTDFGAESPDPNQTTFVCLSGITRIYSPDRKHYVDCGPNKTVTAIRGQKLPMPKRATPFQTDRWRHITEPGDTKYPDPVPNSAPGAYPTGGS